MEELIKKLKLKISLCKQPNHLRETQENLNDSSFINHDGVLISANEAQKIVDALEEQEKKTCNKSKCRHPGLILFDGMTPIKCWKCGKLLKKYGD